MRLPRSNLETCIQIFLHQEVAEGGWVMINKPCSHVLQGPPATSMHMLVMVSVLTQTTVDPAKDGATRGEGCGGGREFYFCAAGIRTREPIFFGRDTVAFASYMFQHHCPSSNHERLAPYLRWSPEPCICDGIHPRVLKMKPSERGLLLQFTTARPKHTDLPMGRRFWKHQSKRLCAPGRATARVGRLESVLACTLVHLASRRTMVHRQDHNNG
jgi:hypothetical protein